MYCAVFLISISLLSAELVVLDDTNSDLVFSGEWFIKVYAPWCPACRGIANSWTDLSVWSDDKDYNIAEIDITKNYALSNQLLVNRIPKLYHVKDGDFRLYQGSRQLEDWKRFLENKEFTAIEPIPWYRKPGSVIMRIFGVLLSFATKVHKVHEDLVSQYGINPILSIILLFVGPMFLSIIAILIIVYILHLFLGKPKPSAAIGPQKPRQRTLSENAKKIIETGMQDEDEKKKN